MVERFIKPNLNGGEISPDLGGRVDLLRYQTAVEHMENFQPLIGGGAMKSPGSRLICPTAQGGRLIRFVKGYNDSHQILAQDETFQFIRFGALLRFPTGYTPHIDSQTTDPDGGGPTEGEVVTLATPYAIEELPDLKWTQANDILYLFHPNHVPMELRRLGLYDWELATPAFGPGIAAPGSVATAKTAPTAAVQETDWYYVVTATDAEGNESYASSSDHESIDMEVDRKNYVTITWAAVAGAAYYTVYKGKGGIYGFIGYTTDLSYRDDNYEPNLTLSPPAANTPFSGTGNYPTVGEFIKQRMAFAATLNAPQSMWISQPALFYNLSGSTPLRTGDGIEFTLVAKQSQKINHLVAYGGLLAFTETAEWAIKAIDGQALSAATIDPEPGSWYGSDPNLTPEPIGDRVLFVQAKGRAVLDLNWVENSTRFTAEDLSVMAAHLFRDRQIVSWAYAETPRSQIFCVLSDGEAVILTYKREQEVWGWSRRTTDGEYLQVSSVPEITEDALYVIVRRNIGGFYSYLVERIGGGEWVEQEDAFFVDSGLSYDNPLSITDAVMEDGVLTITVPTHNFAEADTIRLSRVGGFTSEINDLYSVNGPWTVTAVDGDDVSLTSTVDVPSDVTEWTSGGIARLALTQFTGLGHLQNTPVMVLADGNVIDNLTVDGSGNLTLPAPAARVHAGLPYTGRITSLSLDAGGADGLRMVKNIANINLFLVDSRGVLAGPAGKELYEVKSRAYELYHDPNALLNGPYQVNATGSWTRDAKIEIEAPWPLPTTIAGFTPEIEYGRD